VQDDIAEHVVAAIEPHLFAAEGFRASGRPTESLDSWGLVVSAIGLIHRFEREPNEKAREMLERALSLDPHYARAHSVLSWAIFWAHNCYWLPDRDKTLRLATEHASAALGLDPTEPWSHMMFGFSLSNNGTHERAIESFQTALKLNPSSAMGHMLYGWTLLRAGSFEQAVTETEHALRLSPIDKFSSVYLSTHGLALLAARRFSDALPFLRASITPTLEYMGHHNILISCCGHLGLLDEARMLLDYRARSLLRPFTLHNARLALKNFAHCETFLEGLRKAGVSEHAEYSRMEQISA
jgi:adenylate cyclase